jgi:signal transduction histidine kinase
MNTILSIRTKSQVREKEPVRISVVCKEVKASLMEELVACGGHLDLALSPASFLYANKANIYSIFHNLVMNSLKFRSSERSLQIKIKDYITQEGNLAIEVSDNGTGMNLDKFGDDLFKLYTRFHDSVEGKGMGLFLVKTQVEALDGKIEVKSESGQGTSFTIYFKSPGS